MSVATEKQIQDLRAELYSSRKLQKSLQAQRDNLESELRELKARLEHEIRVVSTLPKLQQEFAEAANNRDALQTEIQKLRGRS